MKTHGHYHNSRNTEPSEQFDRHQRAAINGIIASVILALITLLVMMALTGCAGGLVPMNKQTSTASQAQDKFNTTSSEKLKSVTTGRMQPPAPIPPANRPVTITVSGKDNAVTVPLPEPAAVDVSAAIARGLVTRPQPQPTETVEYESTAGQAASSEDSSRMFSKVKMPLSVALVIGAIGLGMLCTIAWLVIKYLKTTGAGAAALNLADTGLAKMIDSAQEKMMSSTDPKEISIHAMNLAKLEKERGRNARNMQPPKA